MANTGDSPAASLKYCAKLPEVVPERKSDLVSGEYEFDAAGGPTTVAVKITNILGEEVLEQRHV